MSKNKKQPWDEKWKIIESISEGGQGQTHKVELKSSNWASDKYVLKILSQYKIPERRARMYREVAALKTLEDEGIPKLIDSNVEEFKSETKLYMVTEFIEGMTLYEAIKSATMEPKDAIKFLLKLLEIVNYCHQRDIVHRDIKPDNIILRNNDINDPVLIDFGISFNKVDLEETSLTPIGQQLGNRFLYLPEQKINSSAQRSPISDITQCCGILFFAITGENPVSLIDHEGKMPHQQDKIRDYLSRFSPDLVNRIYQIFSRSFQTEILCRWSSIEELKDALISVFNPPAKSQETFLAEIKSLFPISEHQRRQLFKKRAEEITAIIFEVFCKVNEKINEQHPGAFSKVFIYGHTNKGYKFKPKVELDRESNEFYVQYGIDYYSKSFRPFIKGEMKGTEIVLLHEVIPGTRRNGSKPPPSLSGFSEDEYEDIELARTPLNEESNRSSLSEEIETFYYEGVRKMLEQSD